MSATVVPSQSNSPVWTFGVTKLEVASNIVGAALTCLYFASVLNASVAAVVGGALTATFGTYALSAPIGIFFIVLAVGLNLRIRLCSDGAVGRCFDEMMNKANLSGSDLNDLPQLGYLQKEYLYEMSGDVPFKPKLIHAYFSDTANSAKLLPLISAYVRLAPENVFDGDSVLRTLLRLASKGSDPAITKLDQNNPLLDAIKLNKTSFVMELCLIIEGLPEVKRAQIKQDVRYCEAAEVKEASRQILEYYKFARSLS